MTKIDKSKYTKEQWHRIREERRLEKDQPLQLPSVSTTPLKTLQDEPIAFVLGNGTSRKSIKLDELQQRGKTYACNAVYREFSPDYLVAVDVKMILEINKAGYQNTHSVWTNSNRSYRNFKNFNFFNPSKGWSSGPTALWLASQHKYKTIYILGFDYKGLEEGKKVNNIYAGSPNYKRLSEPATFYGNWLRQTATVIKEHPFIEFRRVIQPDNFQPEELNKFSNFNNILIQDFKKMLDIS